VIARNGIRSTLRARGRTALFTALILILTLALTLGLGMWAYCAQTLADMDEQYTSIALVEYMGTEYPEIDTADEDARAALAELDPAAISGIAGVELWEETDRTLAALEGWERNQGTIPYENYAVVECFGFSPSYTTQYEYLTEEELPENYGVIRTMQAEGEDRAYWKLSLYSGGEETPPLPAFFLDKDRGYAMLSGSNALTWVGDDMEDLPEHFVVTEDQNARTWTYVDRTQGTSVSLEGLPVYQVLVTEGMDDELLTLYERSYEAINGYTAVTNRILYARGAPATMALRVELLGTDFTPEPGEKYLLHGVLDRSGGTTILGLGDFYEGCPEKPYRKTEGSGDPALTDSIFAQYAAYYQMANNYIRVEASDDIAALEDFQQGTLYLEQGRFPRAGETGACVVDGVIAGQLGLSVGDTLPVEILISGAEGRFALTRSGDMRTWTVAGITNNNAESPYSGTVWVSGAEGSFDSPFFGYGLGRAVLDNAVARQAADAIQAMAPEGVQVTLYDQGYSAAAQPFEAMRTTAMAVTVAAGCGALAVLLLFAYLFVGRQRETVEILSCLGTPSGKIRLWLLSGAAVIAAAAACLGAGAGAASLGYILQMALAAARSAYAVDLRYSEAALGVTRMAETPEQVPLWPAIAAGAAVLLVALALCAAFLEQARRRSAPKRGKLSVRAPKGGTSVFGAGPARFALLSAKRGGWRSGVAPAAALALVLLLGVLASAAQGWSSQLSQLQDSAVIVGNAASSNGRQSSRLTVKAENARLLWQSGLLEDISVSLGWNYWQEIPDFGSGTFGEERRATWIAGQPRLIALNSLDAAPDFISGGARTVEWLEGWDESCLAGMENYSVLDTFYFGYGVGGKETPTYPCVVSRGFLEDKGLTLGDTTWVMAKLRVVEKDYELYIPLRVVGVYADPAVKRAIYVPLSFWCGTAWITGETSPAEGMERVGKYAINSEAARDAYIYGQTNFSTCRFTLRSAVLEEFRDYLVDRQISQVGRISQNRLTVLLQDQAYTETVSALGRYITFGRVLFPALYLVVGLLGFIISWLMVNARRMEFAILRGLGASRGRVFWSFFLEQGGLCSAGCLLGALILTLMGAGVAGWLAAAGFLACYLVGCALSVLMVGRTHLMSLLSERE